MNPARLAYESEDGAWRISHMATCGAQELIEWPETSLLSEILSQDVFNTEIHNEQEVTTLWLCWEPEQPKKQSLSESDPVSLKSID